MLPAARLIAALAEQEGIRVRMTKGQYCIIEGNEF